ncbi:PH domain-containing protein, partial [Adlercreutzia equolifaciens]|uniref:PH domain-containing protein n=1 Tax=Adlercreutzia equolifaciens TaxID=446660 RepID=UPI0023B1D944
VAIVVVTRLVSYKHLYFTVGPDEFTLYSGVFNKKRFHVPYQRVQSVDQRATLLQRIFGVCTVAIDTAGGPSNKAIVVPYVTKAQAEWLRTELYNRKT